MAINIILFIIGAALVIFGADWLVEGASAVARRARLSEFVIGATIVGIGTSMPEFVVSIISAAEGSADMAVGNVAGSNMFNLLLILGITAVIRPILYTKENITRDIPMCIAASFIFLLAAVVPSAAGGSITRIEGGILLALFILYIVYNFKRKPEESEETKVEDDRGIFKIVLLIILGLGGLIGGGELFVNSAVRIAHSLNVPETVIATTLMAGGTSLPELAVCITAAVKGRGQMAIGNILGSNISNILLIIGASALLTPLHIDSVNLHSIIAVAATSILAVLSVLPLKHSRLSRVDGAVFTAIYVMYIIYII